VLPLLRDGKRFAIYEDALIAAKGSNAGGYELVRVFAKNLKEVTGRILESKPELAMAIQNGTIVNFFPGFILELRNGSNKFADKNWVAGLKEAFSGNWRFYAILVPLIVLPLAAARFYNKLVFAFGRHFGSVLV
jgi:hypothetical protein